MCMLCVRGPVVIVKLERMYLFNLPNLRAALALLLLAGVVACSPGTHVDMQNSADADGTDPDANGLSTQSGTLKLLSVTPNRGPLTGGGQIDLLGVGFADDARVFLGGVACTIAWRGGKTHLYAIVPPVDAPASVDVKVQSGVDANGKPRFVGLTRGYAYLGETHADTFAPALGGVEGGTQITVRGSGFRPGDKVLVGWREASANEVIDDTTLVALTPPAANMGTADEQNAVVAVRHSSGVAVLTGSFLYGRAPRIVHVEPSVVPVAGLDVTLHGGALGHADELYAGGLVAVLAAGTASEVRGATIPAMTTLSAQAQPGLRDMLVSSPFGATVLSPAFAYATATTSAQLLGVSPAQGPSTGGDGVALLAALPTGSKVTGVTWDGSPVAFQQTGTEVTVTTPSHDPGKVDVAIQTDHGSSTLPAAYTYLAVPHVDQIQPASGPPDGGTEVLIGGSNFSGDCTVRIGTWHAQIQAMDGNSIHATTPPGPLGNVDVVVTCDGQAGTLTNGFEYTDGQLHIDAVVPGLGATGGGTPVTVYGSGFHSGMKFYFGSKSATAVTVLDSTHAQVLTPAHDSGLANVDAVSGSAADTLLNGFNYFNPTASNGGTWGEQIGGTLNVTVIDWYAQAAIQDVTVILGQPGQPIFGKYKAFTDAAGQVVFSGPDVVGPITVSASKVDYTATSLVSFDARNVTLLLFPEHPPSNGGGGDPPVALPDPKLEGRVRDFEKYISVPPANCLKGSDAGDKTCDTCFSDADCVSLPSAVTFACIDNGIAGKRCLPDCTQANVCGSGFGCYAEPTWPGHAVCKPVMGIRKVLCAASQRDTETPNQTPPGPPDKVLTGVLPYDAIAVDEATGDFVLDGRLDELAIVCVGGYVTNDTKKFVPTAMGIRRHVFPQPYYKPGDEVKGLDINLDIPLTRNLPTRLDHPQDSYGGIGGSQKVDVWFNLGSDGVVQLLTQQSAGGQGVSGVQPELTINHLPTYLPAELTDTTWIFQATVDYGAGTAGVPPETGTRASDLKTPGDLNVRVRSADGTWSDLGLGVAQELTGVLRGADDQLLVVTRRGMLYRGDLTTLKPIYQPVILDPYAEPLAVLAAAGTPTDATLVGELGLIRRLHGQKVTEEAGALATTLRAVCQNDLLRVAVGDKGGLEVDVGAGWQALATNLPTDLRAVTCTQKGAVIAGDGGNLLEVTVVGGKPALTMQQLDAQLNPYAVVQTDDGTLWLGGQRGAVAALWKQPPGQQWQDGWPAGADVSGVRGLRLLVPLPNQTLLAIDREGGAWRVDATGVVNESPDHLDQRPNAGVALADGSAVFVSQPGLWLGPFLTVPTISSPDAQSQFPFSVTWSAAPGHLPSCNRVHLDGSNFPFWWVYVAPEVTTFALPDYEAVDGIQVFPSNAQYQWVARVDRLYIPGTTINSFATFDIEYGGWRSWATNAVPFHP